MKIPKEVGKQLKDFPTVCRKAAVKLVTDGHEIGEVKNLLAPFIELEKNLYDRLFRKMIRAIQDWRMDPESYAYELSHQLENKEISTAHVITLVDNRLAVLKKEGHRPSRMLEQIKKNVLQYTTECRKFQKYAIDYVLNFDQKGLSLRIGEHTAEVRRQEEDRLFQLQTIHHLRNKQEDCKDLSLPESARVFPEAMLPLALSTHFTNDEKIAYEQIQLINGFFDEEGNMAFALGKPMVVKQRCFDYIANVLTWLVPSPTLIQVSFKGDWVSKEIHDIYMNAFENIDKYGMNAVVYSQVKKLYVRFGLENKKKSELLAFERWVFELEEKYRLSIFKE